MATRPRPAAKPRRAVAPAAVPARRGVRGAGAKAPGHTQALSRGLAVLEALAATDGGATLTTLATRLQLPAPTAHRLLATLQSAGYVQAGENGEWRIGVRAFRVGAAFLSQRNLVVQAYPYLRALMEQSGETANLAVMESGEPVVVEQVQCRELMRMSAKLGARSPIHASGVGKAMLAAMGAPGVAALLSGQVLARHTARTLTTLPALQRELDATRARGYAVDDEEHAHGMRCVAAAVFDEHGEPWAAVSLAGPVTRMTPERIAGLGALVRTTAADLTQALGGRGPAAPRDVAA